MASYNDAVSHSVAMIAGLTIGFVVAKLLGSKVCWRLSGSNSRESEDSANNNDNNRADRSSPTKAAPPGEYKLVIGARQDLGMGKGKIASQCCHAAVACYEEAANSCPEMLEEWLDQGQRKIVVKVENEMQLEGLYAHARALNLVSSVVEDAGRTQIASGSKTVVGVGPGPQSEIDKVMGHLKLY